jgi:hypothetical protein
MKSILSQPLPLFFILALLISLPLFLLPINLFAGEIIIVRNLVEIKEQAPLSLSYFIGLGYDQADMTEIKDFYLLRQGYILAIVLILGIPFLAAYRVFLGNKKSR